MAKRYDLGSVVGEIRFDYDKNGVRRARDDITDKFIPSVQDADKEFDLFSKHSVKAAGAMASSIVKIWLAMAASASAINLIGSLSSALVAASGIATLIPGIFAAIGAGALAVVLGMDGIKKAFEGLDPVLKNMKEQVSASFEKALIPAVNNLKIILPQLTGGFQQIATAIGGVATKITIMLKESSSISALNNIFKQTAQIIQNMGGAIAPLIKAFINIASIGLSFIAPMTKGLAGLAQQFAEWTSSAEGQVKINDLIINAIAVFKLFGQIIVQIGGIIGAIFNGLSTSSGGFGSSLVETLRSVNAFLSGAEGFNALQAIGKTLQDVGLVVRDVLLESLKQLAPSIPPLMKAFSELALQALPPLLAILQFLGPIILKVSQALADNMQWIGPLTLGILAWAAAQWILNAALSANPIGLVIIAIAALVAIVALIITNWSSIVAFFKGVWDAVWKWTTDRITAINQFIVGTWNSILDFFKGIGSKIASIFSAVGDWFSGVIDWFSSLPGKIGNWLVSLPGVLFDAFIIASEFMLNAAIQGVEWVIAFFITLPIKIAQALVALGGLLIEWITTAFTWLTSTLVTLGIELINWFLGLPQRIIDAITSFGQMLFQWISDAWQWLNTTAALKATEFITWITGLPQRIIDAVIDFGRRFGTWIRNAFLEMVGSAKAEAGAFYNWARGIPDQIIRFFQSLPGKMRDIGGDIVRGIWQGIQNLASWLWNRVTDFVGGIVDKVKSLLSIGSPSKVFADEVGQWIPAGIADGIDRNAHLISNSLARVLNPDQMSKLITPMGKAAQEMLNAVLSDKTFFEDFSFAGQSGLGRQFNDQISAMFTSSTGDFSNTDPREVEAFLRNLISAQTTTFAPASTPISSSSSSSVVIQNLNVAGNLDPSDPIAWRAALINIKDGIRDVERQYS